MTITRADLECMDPEGTVDDPNQLQLSVSGKLLAKRIATVLEQHYSGWNWGITIDERNGVVHIFALRLSGDMGYTLLLRDLHIANKLDGTLILTAGGEILERFGARRRAYSPEEMRRVRVGPSGIPIPDVADKQRGLIHHLIRRRGLFQEVANPAVAPAGGIGRPRGRPVENGG